MRDGNVKPEDQYNWVIQYDRNIKLRDDITKAYTKYDNSARNLTEQSSRIGMSNNYYRQFYMIDYQAPLDFALLPTDLITYATTGQIDAWKALDSANRARYNNPADWPPSGTLLDIFRNNRSSTLRQLQSAVNAGLQQGDSYAKISKRVSDIIGSTLDGKATGQLAKALRIVRTEGNRALNAGNYASALTAQDMGIDIVRVWDATLDSRTRPAHGTADGQERPPGEPFSVGGELLMYPGDSAGSASNVIHCRCTTAESADGFKPTARRGKDPVTGKSVVIDYSTFDEWAKSNGLATNKYGQLYKPS
jgi:hypothetical protein